MKIFSIWSEFTARQRQIFLLCSGSFFFFLSSYPAIRSLAQSLFLEHAGVENRPYAWIATIFSLMSVIALFNFLQKKYHVQKLHWFVSILSIFFFGASFLAMEVGQSWGAYTFFIWKEIYIVMLVGLTITFCNNFFTVDQAKLLYGPYGAIGSVGAIIGGQLTSYLSKQQQLDYVFYFGIIMVVVSSILFSYTGKTLKTEKDDKMKVSPLAAIKDVRTYVLFMCLLVASTQFAINSASQIFYILLAEDMPDKFERTAYLGQVFSAVNAGSLMIQLLIMPWLLNKVTSRSVHYFIPVFFLISMSAIGGGIPLTIAGGLFVGFKAIDYSLFSVVKELLYFPLSKVQKYGAKYITDIFVYRSSKTLVAALFLVFSTRDDIYVVLIASLILWLLAVFVLDKHQQKLEKDSSI